MQTGLFFGSFNPIHVGHMVIANYMLEFTHLEKLWFVITPHNPKKDKASLLPDHQRLRLVREAIGDNTRMKASDIEFNLPQPNYTINTLTYLQEKFPNHVFSLILGSDNLDTFHKWRNWELILERHKLLVYPRAGNTQPELKSHPNVMMVDAPIIEISSSFIREAIRDKKDVRYFLPEGVWKYSVEMNFYRK
jgi:nicotinate-nucleotide adenylyltransferase